MVSQSAKQRTNKQTNKNKNKLTKNHGSTVVSQSARAATQKQILCRFRPVWTLRNTILKILMLHIQFDKSDQFPEIQVLSEAKLTERASLKQTNMFQFIVDFFLLLCRCYDTHPTHAPSLSSHSSSTSQGPHKQVGRGTCVIRHLIISITPPNVKLAIVLHVGDE